MYDGFVVTLHRIESEIWNNWKLDNSYEENDVYPVRCTHIAGHKRFIEDTRGVL